MKKQINEQDYLKAMMSCAISINKEKKEMILPDDFKEEIFWNTLKKQTGIELTEIQIGNKRKIAYKIFEQLQIIRSIFNIKIKQEGKEVHISSVWPDKDIKDVLKKIETDQLTGDAIRKLIATVCKPTDKRCNFKDTCNDEIIPKLEPFYAEKAYRSLDLDKIFYMSARKGRGRARELNSHPDLDI